MRFTITFYDDDTRHQIGYVLSFDDVDAFMRVAKALKRSLKEQDYNRVSFTFYGDIVSFRRHLCSYASLNNEVKKAIHDYENLQRYHGLL